MEFKFKCPKCDYIITNNDFAENEKFLANLKQTFDDHKNKYINDLKEKLSIDLEKQFDQKKLLEIEKVRNLLNESKQKELDELNKIITKQYIELENNKVNLEKSLIEKESSINLIKQKEINNLEEQLLKLKNSLDNNEINQKKLLIEKENDLLIKQQEIILKYEEELKNLRSQNEELKITNVQNKVMQNKTKGENFEHEVNGELLKVFEEDVITKITSQDKKADYLQEVNFENKKIGKIVYEVKNAEWSNTWEKKLVEDMARQESKYGILIATSFAKKYPGIPFKKSDENPNIYLCDPDSFVFVGQIIRTLIKIEYKLNFQKNETKYETKINEFNSWKETQLPKFIKIFEDSFTRIKEAESSITKKVDDIRIAREKMYKNALENIKEFFEEFYF